MYTFETLELQPAISFVLRHLQCLQVLNGPSSISGAIQILHYVNDVEMKWPFDDENLPNLDEWIVKRVPAYIGIFLFSNNFQLFLFLI